MIVSTRTAVNIVLPEIGAIAKNGVQPKYVVQPRAELVVDDRPEDEDAPEPEDDARDRGEHLDERADDAANAGGASSLR